MPSGFPRWFLPISGELRLGGRYQLTGNAGGTDHPLRPAALVRGHLGTRRVGELADGHADGGRGSH